MNAVSFRFFGNAVRRATTRTTQRNMSIFTQRTGPLASRLVVDETSAPFTAREPLSPVQKMRLSLLLGGAAVAFGTILYSGASAATNDSQSARSLREERIGYSTVVRERLFSTFGYFVSSLGVTAASAIALSRSEPVLRMALRSPMAFGIGSFIVTIGSMFAAMQISPDRPLLKHAAWGTFTAAQGATLIPIAIIGGPIVGQAAAATGLMVGGISAVAAVAPNDSFLWMSGGLSIGLMTVVGASLGQMFFPASTLLANVSLYGGLALFGGMQLYDTQRVIKHAREMPPTVRYDGMREAIGMYLNTINIFVRMVQIFAQQNNRRR